MSDLLKCKFCFNDEESEYPPIFVVYNTEMKYVEYQLCAQCMHNIEVVLLRKDYVRPEYNYPFSKSEDEIPY